MTNKNAFSSLLLLLFIGLKLTKSIDWSWFWVLSPFWIPLSVALLFMGLALVMAVVTGQVSK